MSTGLARFNRLNRVSGRQIPRPHRDRAGMEIIKNEAKLTVGEASFAYRLAEPWKAVNY
jgi:hypothetical protein